MLNQSSPTVAITRYDGASGAVAKAIELIDGLKRINKNDNVLIKPNVLWGAGGSKHIPRYGFITTSRVVEEIVITLREMGCRKISIGEGCTANRELGSDTLKGFAWSGLARVAKQYDVKLIDFNANPYVDAKVDGHSVEIARAALEADFIVDVPVLKTHSMTRVSLGMKNLKGCLSMRSKKKFHKVNLNEMIAFLNTVIRPGLTVIDGIYAMEGGPTHMGRAHRMNLIVAGTDPLSADMVGASILGIEPKTVGYMRRFAEISERSIEMDSIEVAGEKIEEVCKRLDWRLDYHSVFQAAGIEGITMQFPGEGFCTNCVTCADALIGCYCKDNPGTSLEGVELCFGPEVKAKKDSKKVILIGDCALRANKGDVGAVRVGGCPPKVASAYASVVMNTLPPNRAKMVLSVRLAKGILNKLGVYNERFPREFSYDLPEFDPRHFE